jgi:signal transduction histidine kinase
MWSWGPFRRRKAILVAPSSHPTAGLIDETDRLDSLWSFNRVLEHAARNLNVFGCVLWQAESSVEDRHPFKAGHLFALDSWFEDPSVVVIEPEVPVQGRPEGDAALTRQLVVVSGIGDGFHPDRTLRLTSPREIQSMVCVPIRFVQSAYGVLCLFRQGADAFSEDELPDIERAAEFVAMLYQTSRVTMERSIVDNVAKMLREAERPTGIAVSPDEPRRAALQELAYALAEQLRCMQVSIYLRDLDGLDDLTSTAASYPLAATTAGIDVPFDRDPIRPDDVRLSAWVLRNQAPLRLFNLEYLDRSPEAWALACRRFPGLTWQGERGLLEACRRAAQANNRPPIHHLSYVAVPIIVGGTVLGLIRCLATYRPSNVFAQWDIDTLQTVSTLLGHFVAGDQSHQIAQDDVRILEGLVDGVNAMCQIVIDEVTQSERPPGARAIYACGLKVTREVLGTDSVDVRLIDGDGKALRYFETGGEAWPEGQEANLARFRTDRWPLEGSEKSAGRLVVETQTSHVVRFPDDDTPHRPTFSGVRWAIVAPISDGAHHFGVLDVRCTTSASIPRLGPVVAELLSRQMGIYHYLTNTVSQLQSTTEQLQQRNNTQAQSFRDLKHQLSSPLSQAATRVARLLDTVRAGNPMEVRLSEIRGLVGKTNRVATNVGLFVDVVLEGAIKCTLSNGFETYITKLLSQAASDSMTNADDYRDVRIEVDEKTFQGLRQGEVLTSQALVEQAVDCLFDNATKYSYGGEVVRVFGKRTNHGTFRVVVQSRGLPLTPEEAELCKEYGWRSPRALWTTGTGNGIGLWIVYHIMAAHRGKLIVVPSTDDSVTEVILEFPIASPSRPA